MDEKLKNTVKKAHSVYTYAEELEAEEIGDEIFLFVAKRYLEDRGELPKKWLDYLRSKTGGSDEDPSS